MSRAPAFWIASGIAALILGGGAYHYLSNASLQAGPNAEAAVAPATIAVAVEAERVTVDTVVEDIHAVGSLLPNEAIAVSPEVAGRISQIHFSEGDEVAAGDVLVELDGTILRAELAKARAEINLAEANRKRAMTLAQQGTGTLRARDEAVAGYLAAQANVALAQARLDKTIIAAPFSGVAGLRAVSVGAYVTPGDRIVDLVEIDPIKVSFQVPELALSSLRTGQAIRVSVDAVPGSGFEGTIYAIDPVVDENGRAIRLRARIANPDHVLFPGLFARVQIVVERRENAILVPESAVFASGQDRLVYRVVDGRAIRTIVTLGQRRPGWVEVAAGLDPDAVVVTAGHQQARDGVPVEIVGSGAGS